MITKNEKIQAISGHFREIMKIMGLDLADPNLKDTPQRVAKMYVNELFRGLSDPAPEMRDFPGDDVGKNQMVIVNPITVVSTCSHHFLPFIGTAAVAYIPGKKLLGLSKFSRIVSYCAAKPQLQERLTSEIGEMLVKVLGTEDVAVRIDCTHMCMVIRGAKDQEARTVTPFMSGKFLTHPSVKDEFYRNI